MCDFIYGAASLLYHPKVYRELYLHGGRKSDQLILSFHQKLCCRVVVIMSMSLDDDASARARINFMQRKSLCLDKVQYCNDECQLL